MKNASTTQKPAAGQAAHTHWYISGRTICLPPRFFDDHSERELPTPKVISMRGVSYWVSLDDPALPELLNDAEHYADAQSGVTEDSQLFGLRRSAITTRNRLRAALAQAKE